VFIQSHRDEVRRPASIGREKASFHRLTCAVWMSLVEWNGNGIATWSHGHVVLVLNSYAYIHTHNTYTHTMVGNGIATWSRDHVVWY